MKEYEVTIGIPVYNAGKYIYLSMDSLMAQTFDNIEFLLIDDCGTDNSIDIIRDYQKKHLRGKDIRIVSQPKNMGIGAARNRIITEAKGRYLYFMDADDEIAHDTIEKLYNAIKQFDAEIVYGSYELIEEFGERVNKTPFVYPSISFSKEDEWPNFVYQNYGRIQANTWNFLISLEVIRKNNLRYKLINYWEDFTFTMDLPTYVNRVVLLPDITYHYYCRNGSASNYQKRSAIDKKEIQDTIQAVDEIKANSYRLRHKSYFPYRMRKVMMTDFYIVCSILHQKDIITPSFSTHEIHDIMRSPLSIKEILRFKHERVPNLFLYLLSVLPSGLSVFLMKVISKYRDLI